MSSYAVNSGVNLPAIGVDSDYQLKKEREIGRKFYQRLSHANKIINDPLVEYYIRDMTHILLQGLDRNFREYNVSIINDESINAFAVPGGFIGVNYGLILAAESESQLAGVLAHEIAHINLRHLFQMLNKQSDISSTVLASFLLALVLSQSNDNGGNSEAIEALLIGGTAGAQQSMINFTRENEYEADRKGLVIMKNAGYPAIGVAEFFSILEGRTGGSEIASIEYLRTHPISENRMGEAYQFRLNKVDGDKAKKDEFEYLKVYLNYVIDNGLEVTSHDKSVKKFQYALNFYKENKVIKAKQLLLKLHLTEVENPWVSYMLIKLEIRLKNYQKALAYVEEALVINPKLALWIGVKIDILMLQGEYKKALELVLVELLENEGNQALRYKLVGIYEQLGQRLEAKKVEADYHFFEGNYERAKYLYQLVAESTHDLNKKKGLDEKINEIKQIELDRKEHKN